MLVLARPGSTAPAASTGTCCQLALMQTCEWSGLLALGGGLFGSATGADISLYFSYIDAATALIKRAVRCTHVWKFDDWVKRLL